MFVPLKNNDARNEVLTQLPTDNEKLFPFIDDSTAARMNVRCIFFVVLNFII